MLTPFYPTIVEAEQAAILLGTAVANGTLQTDEDVQAGWVVVGYGLSLGIGTPKADAHMLTAQSPVSGFDWQSLAALILKLLAAFLAKP